MKYHILHYFRTTPFEKNLAKLLKNFDADLMPCLGGVNLLCVRHLIHNFSKK